MTKPLSQTLPEFDDELHIKTLWQMLLDGHKCITRDTGWALMLTTYLDAYIFSNNVNSSCYGCSLWGRFRCFETKCLLVGPSLSQLLPGPPCLESWCRAQVEGTSYFIDLPGWELRLPCVRVRLLQQHTSLIPCQSVEIIIIDTTWFLDVLFDI